MAAPHSPIGSRRRLGAELRRLRTRSKLTLDDVAGRMTCSTSKISRLETGKGIPKVPDVRELMRIYGVDSDAEQDMLLRLVHEGREHGWWEPLTDGVQPERYVLEGPGRYAALENDATCVRCFDMTVVHGLLQTADYTRAVYAELIPHHPAAEIDRLVELRSKRQEALYRDVPEPLAVVAVLDEAVLCREVGGRAVMAGQLAHLQQLGSRPNITVRVLRFGAGFLRAHTGTFVLLDIPTALGSDVVLIESHAGQTYLDTQSDVDLYRDVHDDALQHALSTEESTALISRYRSGRGGAR